MGTTIKIDINDYLSESEKKNTLLKRSKKQSKRECLTIKKAFNLTEKFKE